MTAQATRRFETGSPFATVKVVVWMQGRRCPRGARLGLCTAGFASVLWLTRPVAAQSQDHIHSERLAPAAGPRNLVVTRGARTDGNMSFSAGALASYAHEPLTVTGCADGSTACADDELREVRVVEKLVSLHLLGSLTVVPRLQLGLRVPIALVQGQGLGPGGQPDPDGDISSVGMGEAEIEAKLRLLGQVKDPMVWGVAVGVGLPLAPASPGGRFLSDDRAMFALRGIWDARFGELALFANVAPTFRQSSQLGTSQLGSELRYAAGGRYWLGDDWRLLLEALGATRLSSDAGTNLLELIGALELALPAASLTVQAGGGAGVLRGIGGPLFRGFLGLAYVQEVGDRDGDGFDDAQDKCPSQAEDLDGHFDSDGCPDLDDDGDRVLDAYDKCPLDAEDIDEFQDKDGCPDPDNDGDGILDERDRCPNEDENFNGFQDHDGCPDKADADGDGMPDNRDKCPSEAEDTDGFEDDDGCVDPDNDGDGVNDPQDECPDGKEIHNGRKDTDGCPD